MERQKCKCCPHWHSKALIVKHHARDSLFSTYFESTTLAMRKIYEPNGVHEKIRPTIGHDAGRRIPPPTCWPLGNRMIVNALTSSKQTAFSISMVHNSRGCTPIQRGVRKDEAPSIKQALGFIGDYDLCHTRPTQKFTLLHRHLPSEEHTKYVTATRLSISSRLPFSWGMAPFSVRI